MIIASKRQEIVDKAVDIVSRIRNETDRANVVDFVMESFESLGIEMDRQEFINKVGL